MTPPSAAYQSLYKLIDAYTARLNRELKERLEKGYAEYGDVWTELTPIECAAMAHEEELDLINYRLMLLFHSVPKRTD